MLFLNKPKRRLRAIGATSQRQALGITLLGPAARFRMLAALLAIGASGALAANGDAQMSDRAAERAHSGGTDKISVIVHYHARPDQAEDNRLNGLGATDKRAYGKLKMRALKIKASKLSKLANHQKVKFVTLDSPVESFTEAARLATNELLHKGLPLHEGDGIGVAVLDSGISTHNDVHKGESVFSTRSSRGPPVSRPPWSMTSATAPMSPVLSPETERVQLINGTADSHRKPRSSRCRF